MEEGHEELDYFEPSILPHDLGPMLPEMVALQSLIDKLFELKGHA